MYQIVSDTTKEAGRMQNLSFLQAVCVIAMAAAHSHISIPNRTNHFSRASAQIEQWHQRTTQNKYCVHRDELMTTRCISCRSAIYSLSLDTRTMLWSHCPCVYNITRAVCEHRDNRSHIGTFKYSYSNLIASATLIQITPNISGVEYLDWTYKMRKNNVVYGRIIWLCYYGISVCMPNGN